MVGSLPELKSAKQPDANNTIQTFDLTVLKNPNLQPDRSRGQAINITSRYSNRIRLGVGTGLAGEQSDWRWKRKFEPNSDRRIGWQSSIIISAKLSRATTT